MRKFAHYFWGCSLSIFLIGNVELETDPPYSIAPYIHVCALLLQSRKFWPSPLQIADHFCEQPLIIMRQRTEIHRKWLNSAVFCVLLDQYTVQGIRGLETLTHDSSCGVEHFYLERKREYMELYYMVDQFLVQHFWSKILRYYNPRNNVRITKVVLECCVS